MAGGIHRLLCKALTEKGREWLAAWDAAHPEGWQRQTRSRSHGRR